MEVYGRPPLPNIRLQLSNGVKSLGPGGQKRLIKARFAGAKTNPVKIAAITVGNCKAYMITFCLLYTSDAADE